MTRALTLVALLTAAIASAQDLATYNKALSAYNGGSFEDSARLFFDVYNTTTFSGTSTTWGGDFILHNYGTGAGNSTTITVVICIIRSALPEDS